MSLEWFKSKQLGAVRINAEERRKVQNDLWIVASKTQKKKFFCIVSWRVMKNEYVTIIRTQKSWCRRIINLDGKAEYSLAPISCFVFGGGIFGEYSVLWVAPTQRNHHWGTLPTTIDAIESSTEAKTARLREKTRQSDFPAWQRSAICCEIGQGNIWSP